MNTLIPRMKFDEVVDGFFNKSLSDIIGTDFSMSNPALNVIENEDNYTLELAAPGLEKSDFDVQIDKQILSISSEKKSETESEEKGEYRRREYNYSAFRRRMRLPRNVDATQIKANYEDGILRIKLAKKAKEEVNHSTRIEIG